jgi:flavin reductase (DIM6/NTAB) family NADH-FMN oxidoreductase RutF
VAAAPAAFHHLVAAIDYPMYIVTAAAGGQRSGCLVGFTTQGSIEPPRMIVCVSKANHTFGVAAQARVLVLHFLSVDDRELADLFGEKTGDDVDKFARCQWDEGPDGTPVLRGCRGWVAGPILERFDAGDHVAMLIAPEDGQARHPDRPQLGFHDVVAMVPGHPVN